jgi:hypothetical protein
MYVHATFNMPNGSPTVMKAKNAMYKGVLGGDGLTMTIVDIHVPVRKVHLIVRGQK